MAVPSGGSELLRDPPGQDDGAISVALSPVQLAAILDEATISERETLANRIWGGVGLVGGALELIGSAALLVDPDPTVSKVIGAVGIVHGSDVTMTSWNQLRTGRSQQTLTSQAAAALAQSVGASPEAAGITGVIVDILVPTGVMSELGRANSLARLTRVRSVQKGFVSLVEEERDFNLNKPSASAHTIREHVGKSFQQMMDRFAQKPGLEATGSFRDIQTAEAAVSKVLSANKNLIRAWAQAPNVGRPLRISLKLAQDVGEAVINPSSNPLGPGLVQASLRVKTVTVVLNKTTLNGRTWYVLSAFPDIMRDLGLTAM